MQQSEIKNIANEVYRLTDAKLFALAFVRLRLLLKDLQEWWAIQRCEELETLCGQMLKYSLGDYEDPQRGDIVEKLQRDIYLLVDDVVDAIAYKLNRGTFHIQKAIYANELLNFRFDEYLLEDDRETFDLLWEDELNRMFGSVWVRGRLSIEECNYIISFLRDEDLPLPPRAMMISALMLKALRMYDESVFVIYLDVLQCESPMLRARAMVGC